jgi:TatD DNase family protein
MSSMRLVDSHCHLNLPDMQADLSGVMARAAEAGVETVVVPGIDLGSSRKAVEMAERWPGVYAAVGVHPHHATGQSSTVQTEIRALAQSPRVVAIGEIGLDFYRNLAPRPAQVELLRAHLELAAELGLPVIVHSRSALPEIYTELKAWAARNGHQNGRPSGVLHAFSGDLRDAQRAIDLGFFLGVAGPVTYPKAEPLRSTLSGIASQHLLIETDAPYMAPAPHRGQRNEPAYVALVARGLAGALGLDAADLASLTSHNATRLFGWTHDDTNRHLL